MNLADLIESLLSQAESLEDINNTAIVLAEQSNNEIVLGLVSDSLVKAGSLLRHASSVLKAVESNKESMLTSDELEEVVAMANELDNSADPTMRKRASVLDQILLTIGAQKGEKEAFKLAEEKEVSRLREKYREQSIEDCYKKPKEILDNHMKVADMEKAIKDNVKEFRPLETSLSTRTCPDHPGAQMIRVADYIFQCSLDKKMYNYQAGYISMKGNKVPGGDVSLQSQSLTDRPIEHLSFDTRESKLNNS